MDFLVDFLVVTGVVGIFVFLSWMWCRAVSGGRRLNPFKRRLLIYASIFVAGMGYLMLVASDLHWPDELMFPLIGLWGVAVGLVWWFRYRRERAQRMREDQPSDTER